MRFFLNNYYLNHPIQRRIFPIWEIFSAKYGISRREAEIIRLLIDGKSNKDIEEELFISIKTVKNHIFKIYKKLKIKNRIQLINLVHNFTEDK
jgi:DNA-binding NarL/FixJ family response regulator